MLASAKVTDSLIWGMAYPVKIASLTTQLPPKRRISHETFLKEVFSYSFLLAALGFVNLLPRPENKGIAYLRN